MADGVDSQQASAYRLWLQLIEAETRSRLLQSRLSRMENSRSWRITAPLRALVAKAGAIRSGTPPRPALQPAAKTEIPAAWQPVFAAMAHEMGLPGLGGDAAAPRCLVDVTELALEDLGAGVQRVTRRWLSELLVAPPDGYGVEPVRLSDRGEYVLARDFLAGFLGLPAGRLGQDGPMEQRSGDLFLGLDFCRDRATMMDRGLGHLQSAGTVIALVLPDMLPRLHPEWFPPGIAPAFDAWLEVCAGRADQVVCISRDSAQAFKAYLASQGREPVPEIVVAPLGADFPPCAPGPLPPKPAGVTRLLMVGTVEPRKRYPQALDALEDLLARGRAVDMLMIGHRGWESDAFIERLLAHPQMGSRLHWLEDAGDGVLASAYRDSDLLLMASAGEGYGLPIGEAARAGCSLLLRDIAVFREVAGDAADYFSGDDAADLSQAISCWLDSPGTRSNPAARHWTTWEHSSFSLKNETIRRLSSFVSRSPSSTPGMRRTATRDATP